MRELGQVGGILSYFARHKTAANLLLVILITAGIVAFPKMRTQFFPDVVVDTVSVTAAVTRCLSFNMVFSSLSFG